MLDISIRITAYCTTNITNLLCTCKTSTSEIRAGRWAQVVPKTLVSGCDCFAKSTIFWGTKMQGFCLALWADGKPWLRTLSGGLSACRTCLESWFAASTRRGARQSAEIACFLLSWTLTAVSPRHSSRSSKARTTYLPSTWNPSLVYSTRPSHRI